MVIKLKNVKQKNKKTGQMEMINPYTPAELEARKRDPNVTPQTTLKATGETRPDVYNEKKKRWESPFTDLEHKKALAISEAKQKADIQKAVDEAMIPEPTESGKKAAELLNIDPQIIENLSPEDKKALGLTDKEILSGEGVAGVGQVAAGGVAGALAGAGTGAAIGSVIPGVGTAVGGVVGGVLGATGGGFAKISISKRQDVKAAYAVSTTAESNMIWIINQVNSGKMDPLTARTMWDDEMGNFAAAERNLKKDTKTGLNRFLSGGVDEMEKADGFRRRIPYYKQALEQAFLYPNAKSILNEQQQTTIEAQ